jgi:SAM-dependent methyltransferase
MHQNSRLLFEKYAKPHFCPGTRVLEIGPDKVPSSYQILVSDSSISWDTLDLRENPLVTYRSIEDYSFPIPDNTYDVVLSGNVMEHVRKTWIWIKELGRVCKAGGLVITVVPVSWPYHEAPVDCWRIYPEGMRALYEEADLDVIEMVCDSLEEPGYPSYIPGRSLEWQTWKSEGKRPGINNKLLRKFGIPFRRQQELKRKIRMILLSKLGVPVERAYDTIAIGQKRESE